MSDQDNNTPAASVGDPVDEHCSRLQLEKSLREELTEREEELLVRHLSKCSACQKALERLAADNAGWLDVGSVLREESLSGTQPAASNVIDGDDAEGMSPKGTDFIVDFLQPSEDRESLGRLGNIEIRAFIGQGAHGIVLKGYQAELNRVVAVKVISPHLASIPAARKRFSREAKAAAAIVHPNVMPILHVDSGGQLPFLVMPYCDCESLQERIERHGELLLTDVLRIGVQVAKGLAAAHAQGLVHRDVKPANILLERGVERVMLTDFGLARAVDDATLTRSGLIAGTPHYMSPEQARGEGVDSRSDLFSLGSVLYAMTTGRPPFRAETTYGILRRVTDEPVRSVREFNPELPEWFDAIVMKLLRKSAVDRFASASEVASVLEECLAHLQQPARSPLPTLVTEMLPGRSSANTWWLAAAVTVAATMVLILGLNGLGKDASNEIDEGDVQETRLSRDPLSSGSQQASGPQLDPRSPDSDRPVSADRALSDVILPDDYLEQELEELTREADRLLIETMD